VSSAARIIELEALPGDCLRCWTEGDSVSIDLHRFEICNQWCVHQILYSAVDRLRVNWEEDNNSNFKVENNQDHCYVGYDETRLWRTAGYETEDAEHDEDTADHGHDDAATQHRLLDVYDVVDALIAGDVRQGVRDRGRAAEGDDTEDEHGDTAQQKN